MKIKKKYILWGAVLLSIFAIFAVASHSIDEIHYLKRSYPSYFTVEEAYFASRVELIKVIITAIPLVVVIFSALYILKTKKHKK